ncbi:hypothetical protein SteCoe_29505 [Stentor coeruleus]|uniref:Uncharacterized protein n=1 Tax=Stentor coeruleus TaxID=5963 RepID=A0A1R2B5S8_9CILI|nr:hypothetical protein SteCoe_29505 [Stentor coeruleus]
MNIFGNKISLNHYFELTAFIALQHSFEEFYNNIQKNPYNKSDIPADSISTYFQKIVFKNSSSTCEIAFPMIDLQTALRIYQELFNANYMNLNVIEIDDYIIKSIFTTNDLKKMLKGTSNWPEIICFTISSSFELNFLNIFGPVLEQSNDNRWVLKSIIAVRGSIYLSIVRKGDFWSIDFPTNLKANKIGLSEAISKVFEAGFMPVGFFYFYHNKEVPKLEFITKDVNKYIKYKQKTEQPIITKSVCLNQKILEKKILKEMNNGIENDIRKLKNAICPKTYDLMNAVLGNQEKLVMKIGNYEIVGQKNIPGNSKFRHVSSSKEYPIQTSNSKMPQPMRLVGKSESRTTDNTKNTYQKNSPVSKPPLLALKINPSSPQNLKLKKFQEFHNNPSMPPEFNVMKTDENFFYQATQHAYQNPPDNENYFKPLSNLKDTSLNMGVTNFTTPPQITPGVQPKSLEIEAGLEFKGDFENLPQFGRLNNTPYFKDSNQELPAFSMTNQRLSPTFRIPDKKLPPDIQIFNLDMPPAFPGSNQNITPPNQNIPPAFAGSNQNIPPAFPGPNQNITPTFLTPNQNIPPAFLTPSQKTSPTILTPNQNIPPAFPAPNQNIPPSFPTPNQSIPPPLLAPNQSIPPAFPSSNQNIPPLFPISSPSEIRSDHNILYNENPGPNIYENYPPQHNNPELNQEYSGYQNPLGNNPTSINPQEYNYNNQYYNAEGLNSQVYYDDNGNPYYYNYSDENRIVNENYRQ